MSGTKQRIRCPNCADGVLATFFAMRQVPVHCNVLFDSPAQARAARRGDIELGFCRQCAMIFNVAFDPTLLTYTSDYENSLHGSPRFQAYAEALARRLCDKYRLLGAHVVEVGCGKGDFLLLLADGGRNRGTGFDASYDGRHTSPHMRIVASPWDAALAQRDPADLIACRHVLEHIDTPLPFLTSIRAALRTGGAVYLEVPDAMYSLRDRGIWDVIYEHCSYLTAPAIERLCHTAGLHPTSIASTFGGQFLGVDAGLEPAPQPPHQDPVVRRDDVAACVRDYADAFRTKVAHWGDVVIAAKGRRRRTAVWGAGSKGVTFLNTVAGGDAIDSVIDVNPRKVGRCVPGTGHRIQSPEQLAHDGVDTVFVMNPNYGDEIAARLRGLGLAPELLLV